MRILSQRAEQLTLSPLQSFFRKARELQRSNPEIISFAVGEPVFTTPLNIKSAGIAAIRDNKTRYTAAGGMMELRKKAAEDFQKSGIEATADNTIISAGSQPLIAAAILAITDPGETVLVPQPYYPPFITLIKLFGARPILVNTSAYFNLNGNVVKEFILKNTKALIFNSPNNPTGVVWNPGELVELPDDLYFIADEAYQRIFYGTSPFISAAAIPEFANRTITIRSCSKTFNMTGWRIGYLTGPREVTEKIEIILEAIMVSPCSISQGAALGAFDETEEIINKNLAQLQKRRDILTEWLEPFFYFPRPQGAFYVFANLPRTLGLTSTELADSLLEKIGVVVTPGIAFGDDRFIRISYASVPSIKKLKEGLKRIEKFLNL